MDEQLEDDSDADNYDDYRGYECVRSKLMLMMAVIHLNPYGCSY